MKFHFSDFIYFLCNIILQNLKKNKRVDPEIKVYITLGYNRTKPAHLAQMKMFWKFHSNDIYLLIVSYHPAHLAQSFFEKFHLSGCYLFIVSYHVEKFEKKS